MAADLESPGHDEVADTGHTLVARSRGLVYAAAGLLLLIAVVLAALRVGEKPGRLSDWQAFVLGVTQGASELLALARADRAPVQVAGH